MRIEMRERGADSPSSGNFLCFDSKKERIGRLRRFASSNFLILGDLIVLQAKT